MKKIILLLTIFTILGCWTDVPLSTQLNSNCSIPWIEGDQAYVDKTSPIKTNTEGDEVITNGFFKSDQNGQKIVINSKSTDDVRIHEFCHLIDFENGDYHKALSDLGTGYPKIIDKFVAYLDRHPDNSQYAHWKVLRDLYAGEGVVEHQEILMVIGGTTIKVPLNINK